MPDTVRIRKIIGTKKNMIQGNKRVDDKSIVTAQRKGLMLRQRN